MLTIGDKFPEFNLKAVVSREKGKEFADITNDSYEGKWKVVFFWPMDFTFICPTEIAEFGRRNGDLAAHAAGALVLVDGAQLVPHVAVDVAGMDCDFLTISGHKMLGPTASGGLYAKRELLESMDPFISGGHMIDEVFHDRATWNVIPYKFEAGTMNIAQEVGLGAAIDYLEAPGMDAVRAHEEEITAYAIERLLDVGATIYGPTDVSVRGGAVSFWYKDVHPHDLATILNEEGVAIRAGHHCNQPVMRRYGVPATARASFYVYNTNEEVGSAVRFGHLQHR